MSYHFPEGQSLHVESAKQTTPFFKVEFHGNSYEMSDEAEDLVIALDTNVIANRIKFETETVRRILAWKLELKFQLAIPDPVFKEVRAKGKAEVASCFDRFRTIKSEMLHLGIGKWDEVLSASDAETNYLSNLDKFIAENKISIIPFPSQLPTHEVLFDLATAKVRPFDPQGNNYRDAIIYYSLQEFCLKNQNTQVVFISGDLGFQASDQDPSNFRILKPNALADFFDSRQSQEAQDKAKQIMSNVEIYMKDSKARSSLNGFISGHVDFSYAPRVAGADAIEWFFLNEIKSLKIDAPPAKTEVKFSGIATGMLTLKFDRPANPFYFSQPISRVGDTRIMDQFGVQEVNILEPEKHTEEVLVSILFGGTAKLKEKDQIESVLFEKARLQVPWEG